MDKINIENLCSTTINSSPLDVRSIYAPKRKPMLESIKKVDFDINRFLNKNNEIEKKVKIEYKKKYNLVLNKINIAYELDKTEIIYTVDTTVFRCKEYNQQKCLGYIQTELRKMYMDTLLSGDGNSIFISWKNIEENKKNSESEDKNKNVI